MITEENIRDMYAHLRTTDSSIPDEAIEFMKNVCLEHLDKSHHSFTYIAQPTTVDGKKMVGVWTDGVSLISDNESDCEYPLEAGKPYRVSVVRLK